MYTFPLSGTSARGSAGRFACPRPRSPGLCPTAYVSQDERRGARYGREGQRWTHNPICDGESSRYRAEPKDDCQVDSRFSILRALQHMPRIAANCSRGCSNMRLAHATMPAASHRDKVRRSAGQLTVVYRILLRQIGISCKQTRSVESPGPSSESVVGSR
jgi:hypothetical protein